MRCISSLNEGRLKKGKNFILEFESETKMFIKEKSFSFPGMIGSVCVNRIDIVVCQAGKPFEFKAFFFGGSGIFLKTDNLIKKILVEE